MYKYISFHQMFDVTWVDWILNQRVCACVRVRSRLRACVWFYFSHLNTLHETERVRRIRHVVLDRMGYNTKRDEKSRDTLERDIRL